MFETCCLIFTSLASMITLVLEKPHMHSGITRLFSELGGIPLSKHLNLLYKRSVHVRQITLITESLV